MPLTPLWPAGLALVAALAWTAGPGLSSGAAQAALGGSGAASAGAAKVPTYRAVIAPFPVSDSTGRLLEMAFLGGFNSPRPQLVDADGDGDLDLFVQEVTGKVGYYERDGERDGLPRFVFRTDKYAGLDIGQWYRFADVDRDGDLDMLAEQPFSYVRYYRNEGGKGAIRFVNGADTLRDVNGAPIFADAQNIAQLGDLDCNDRADLLIGRLDGTVSRYEATEVVKGTSSPAPKFQLVVNEFEGIKIVGEGQVGGMPNMPGGGKQGGPLPSILGNLGKHGANTMALADYDNDGDLDLFWGDYFEPGLLLIENTGTCKEPNFRNTPVRFPREAPFATSGYNAPTFGDVNGDGRADLVFGVLGGAFNPILTSADNLYYVEQTAKGGWVTKSRQLLPVLDIGSETIPAIVDIDGDGDMDLLLANKIDPNDPTTSRIYRYENVGTKTKPELKQRGWLDIPSIGRSRFHFAPIFADLDGDGKQELILGEWGQGGKSSVAWYKIVNGKFVVADTALITIPRGSNTTPTLGDLDGDGDLDMLVGENSGWLNFYRNDGTKTAPKFTLVSEEYENIKIGRRSAPHLVDIDNDGDLDLLLGSEADGVALFRNVGTRTAPRFERDTTFAPPTQAYATPTTGDLNGDGKLEILVGGAGGGVIYLEQQ